MSERIIVQQLHGHWSAWWEHEPQIAFGGATPAEAVDRLVGFTPTDSMRAGSHQS